MSYLGYPYQIKQASPVIDVEFDGDFIRVPEGTTTQRNNNIPIPLSGMFRFNSTENSFEGYNGEEWGSIGGVGRIDFVLADGVTESSFNTGVFPLYSETGVFTPICLLNKNVPFVLADGTVTHLRVKG